LHYLIRGRGECLLLIHGLGSSAADWAMQVPALESRWQLIVPDLPGCGHSGPLPHDCSIESFAKSLWTLLERLQIERANIVGYSLGGAVALEMALQRPDAVARLALINTLASYQIDHWRKWLEARVPAALVHVLGMGLVGRMFATRLFPYAWQQPLRERAARVIAAVPGPSYIGLMKALERWTASDRLAALSCKSLLIAAEHDYVPVAQQRLLAAALGAQFALIRGSRHGTPFDSVQATNASLLAFLSDQALPAPARLTCDEPRAVRALAFAGSLAEEHALGP
jgi:pimeloyl-ACP methyl ester carboxylesterase